MKSKIILVGMMGCGKTVIGKILSERLKFPLFESDEIFEKRNNILIKDYFSKYGENSFRQKETEILKEILKEDVFILSSGGGIVLKEENRNLIFNDKNNVVYLKTSIDELYLRLQNDNQRPLLMVENPKAEIQKIMLDREKYYSQANIVVETDNKNRDEIVEEIIKNL